MADSIRPAMKSDGTGFTQNRSRKGGTVILPASWALIAILLATFVLGGGGSKYGLFNLIVQITALIALSFHREAFFDFWKTAPFSFKAVAAITIILPLLYTIPLPAGIWSAMPGRELVAQSYDLIGGKQWSTLSVDPIRTLLAASALILPLAIVTIGWSAPQDDLILAGWIIVALGIIGFFIGVPQVLSTGQEYLLYPENRMEGVLFGTFANRNSGGLFLVGVMALATVLPPPARFANLALFIRIVICTLLLVAVILTRSRTALVLAFFPIAFGGLRAFFWQMKRSKSLSGNLKGKKNWIAIAPISLIIATIAAVLIAAPGRVNETVDRFSQTEDARTYIWEDATYSAKRFWPVGSGTGTFDDVFQVDESLENMTTRRAGRAHNDYIEAAIETGAAGIALIVAWFVLIAWLSIRARKSQQPWIAWSGSIILLVIALQSVTDYPLRNLTMLTLGGFALLILARFSAPRSATSETEVLP